MGILESIKTIIVAAVTILVCLVAVVKVVREAVEHIKSIQAATPEEREAAKKVLVENLRTFIFKWVTDSEGEYGGGTGKLKSANVAALVYGMIPDDFKPLFSAKEIQELIDDVLKKAKVYWEENPKAREYIEAAQLAKTVGLSVEGPFDDIGGVPGYGQISEPNT